MDSINTYQHQPSEGELDNSEFTTMTVTKSGNIVFAGLSKTKNESVHGLVTVLEPDIKRIWSHLYRSTDDHTIEYKSVVSDDMGHVFIAGQKRLGLVSSGKGLFSSTPKQAAYKF